MQAENHISFQEEKERCDYTLEYVQKSLESFVQRKDKIDKDLDNVRKHFNSENSQDYIDMIVNSELQSGAALKIKNLSQSLGKPYFARVDFTEEGKESREKLYIGKVSIMRDEDQELVIVDWRAPVSNLYYEGRLGDTSYECPQGIVEGELQLKRQFTIQEGILEEIFDIDITTNDQLLQKCLGASADNRLKDIVSTIQAEQNCIIRADMWKPLIVQGAAGSGKTTIALHRIAYLIYMYEKTFEPENFMILAPNKLFLNYISEVLPELGVERVKQTTFEEFAMELIGKRFKVKDPGDKLTRFVNQNQTPEDREYNSKLKKSVELKSSITFKGMIDAYIADIETNFIPRENFTFANITLYKYEELNEVFLHHYKNWPIAVRINELKKYMTNRMKARKEIIINKLHEQCDITIQRLKQKMEDSEERQQLIIRALDQRDEKLAKMEALAKSAIKEYIGKISRLDPFEYYRKLVTDSGLLEEYAGEEADRELLKFTARYSEEVFKTGMIEVEDFAPMIYLKYKIYGMDEKIPVKHIVVDEAQDFSVFQFYVLKKIVKDSSFTILGDLCQGIHSYRGIQDWEGVRLHAFGERSSEILTLEQSYRTTVEIMEAANRVLRNVPYLADYKAKPVIRHGEPAQLIPAGSLKEIVSHISECITAFQHQNMKSMAVICKTLEQCKAVAALFKKTPHSPYMISGKESEYKTGLVIVPSYLSKGLEFDAVFIVDGDAESYTEDELDAKLLYVAMTRPLHRLLIYHIGEESKLLQE